MSFPTLFRFFRRQHDSHPLSFKDRHLLHLAIIFQIVGKPKEQHFALLFKQNGTPAEKHVGFHLRAFLQESLGVFQLEIVIMVVRLRSEPDLLHDYLDRLRLLFLLTLP